jgi:hypothetical protein
MNILMYDEQWISNGMILNAPNHEAAVLPSWSLIQECGITEELETGLM